MVKYNTKFVTTKPNSPNFSDLEAAYNYKTTKDLKLAYLGFSLMQNKRVIAFLKWIASAVVRYRLPIKFILKSTIFKIFCAGESYAEANSIVKELNQRKVSVVLDYVSESESSVEGYEKTFSKVLENIKMLSGNANKNYISIKISGLEDHEFLKAISLLHMPLEVTQKERRRSLFSKIDSICKAAKEAGICVFIDAEERSTQNIIDAIAEEMMSKYNNETAWVYNTLQMYLKDRILFLHQSISNAKKGNYYAGIKLVRGAYMERERQLAAAKNLPSPVWESKSLTDIAFNGAIGFCLQNSDSVYTCVASHNLLSTQIAVEGIESIKNKFGVERLHFSQLFGMCDFITFNLAAVGYATSKYLPFGELEKAIPYLIRRSEENTSIEGQVNDEVWRLKKEINRRKITK